MRWWALRHMYRYDAYWERGQFKVVPEVAGIDFELMPFSRRHIERVWVIRTLRQALGNLTAQKSRLTP